MSDDSERDPDQPDEKAAPGARQVEVDVEPGDEPGPCCLAARHDLSPGIGEELAILPGIDIEEEAREVGGGERDIDMLDPGAALGDRTLERGLDGARRDVGHLRRGRAFPALELVREDREAARQADEVDERREGETETAVPAQHRADEAGRDARHQVFRLFGPGLARRGAAVMRSPSIWRRKS